MMGFYERCFHAVLFELLAILLSIAALKLVSQHQLDQLTIMVILISVIAVFWNFIFNWLFDRIFTGPREKRSVLLRIGHTLAFEGGLLMFTLPLVAYWLEIDWWSAFLMDIGLTLLILVYTFIFNWTYDHLRLWFIVSK